MKKSKGLFKEPFFILPKFVLKSPVWKLLSPYAVKLLMDLAAQYSGFNNGQLVASFNALKGRGWKSKSTLDRAEAELLHYRLIVKTRQGGKNKPNWYGLTFHTIDDGEGRYDCDVGKHAYLRFGTVTEAFIPRRKCGRTQWNGTASITCAVPGPVAPAVQTAFPVTDPVCLAGAVS